jgi:hypothetical protein
MNAQWQRPVVVKQRCVKCGGTYDREVAFRKNRHNSGPRALSPDTHATCIGCEQTERDKHKAVDPAKEPYLETNTQPCCGTCNTSKSNSSPELWARKLRFWREWEDNQQHVEARVQFELELSPSTPAIRSAA